MSKKTALVTGGNKGIGKEVVRQLAGHRFQVYLGSRDAARRQVSVDELRAAGLYDVHLLVIDVTSEESVKSAVETLSSRISALDVLVDNAGVHQGYGDPIQPQTALVLQATYNANVYGVVRTTVGFLDLLKKSKAGRIVNVSSGLASFAVNTDPTSPYYAHNTVAYNSSKSAVNMITVSHSKSLAEFGIKVNACCPGYVATDINKNTGFLTVDIGAIPIIKLATLPDDGPTGTYINKDGPLPW